jgi:ABC-2 type transport system ATP-binding protein
MSTRITPTTITITWTTTKRISRPRTVGNNVLNSPAIRIAELSHRYGEREAIRALSLEIPPAEIFVLLGPNGSGKTTLFRVLSTLIPLQRGSVTVFGHDLARDSAAVRSLLGVVFQAPSVDKKLTVRENLRHHGRLYGLGGRELAERIDAMLNRLGLTDRANERAEKLSGGLRRRVELAQGMLHRPRLLLLDEPSTGLDPGARSDVWSYLEQVRQQEGVTVVLTTHLLEEAERADRIAIMHQGELVALDSPAALQASVGGDSITIRTANPAVLAREITDRFDCAAQEIGNEVRLEQPDGHDWIPRLMEAFVDRIESITLGKPTLEDVFIDRTGHRFWNETPPN